MQKNVRDSGDGTGYRRIDHTSDRLQAWLTLSSVGAWMCAAVIVCLATATASAWEPKSKAIASGKRAFKLSMDALNESSGLAFSHLDAAYIWSHNDSGDKARLLSFNQSGKYCGRVYLDGVKAVDWEDMASFDDNGPRLLVADVGDNSANRESVSLYLFDEPHPRKKSKVDSFQHLVVRYADGAQNCESVAVDIKNRRILLLGKAALLATMHEIPLPLPPENSEPEGKVTKLNVTTKAIQRIAIPMATGMDLCPKTGDLWVSSYFHAYRYPAAKRVSLESRLKRIPDMIELPKLKQVEAIAIDDKGRIWVTSEGKPAMMQRVMFRK